MYSPQTRLFNEPDEAEISSTYVVFGNDDNMIWFHIEPVFSPSLL